MIVLWIILAVLIAVLAMAFGYIAFVNSLYPEKIFTTEVQTLVTGDIWKLRLCRYRKGRTTGEPVLLVHGATANQHNLSSPAGHSLVEYLVERGYDCWTIDLRGTRSSVPPFERRKKDATIDGMLMFDLPAAIQHIRRTTGYGKVHYVGHSLGGMLLYAYAQEHGEDQIASGVTLASPLGFDGLHFRVPVFTFMMATWFPHFSGNVIRAALPLHFLLRHAPKYFPVNVRNLHPSMNTAAFMNLIEDPLPNVARELAYWVRNKIWRMKREELDVSAGLHSMRFPLLAFYAPLDPFVSLTKAEEFFASASGGEKEMVVLSRAHGCQEDYSHCDVAFSRNGALEVYQPIAEWLETHPVRQRIGIEEMGTAQGDYIAPLDAAQRARILSGHSYAHLAEEGLSGIDHPAPTSVEPIDESIDSDDERLEVMQLDAAEEMRIGAIVPAGARNSLRKQTAARKASPQKPPAAKAKPARTAKTVAKAKQPKAKAPARKAEATRPAAKRDASGKAVVGTAKIQPTGVQVPERTKKALRSAAAQLRELDKPKKK